MERKKRFLYKCFQKIYLNLTRKVYMSIFHLPHQYCQLHQVLLNKLLFNIIFRLIYKNLHCIEHHVASCRTPHTRIMGDLVPWIRQGLEESTCSGEEAGYECGMRSIMGLALTVANPGMPRMTVCRYTLNIIYIKLAFLLKKCNFVCPNRYRHLHHNFQFCTNLFR